MAKFLASTQSEISERELRNQERSRKIASQGMVLLSNNGVLPLKSVKKLALYGNGARRTVKGGTGSGDVHSRNIVNVEQGLEAAGVEIATKKWLDKFDADMAAAELLHLQRMEQAKEKGIEAIFAAIFDYKEPGASLILPEDIAADCSTAIYVIARNSGEGMDRKYEPGDYLLNDNEKENLKILTDAYEKVVVILNVGGVIDTGYLRSLPGIDAILLMSQAGNMGGYALADILTGKETPSGHLATTWAEKYEDYPCAMTFGHMNGNVDDEYYTEGIYVGYRYFDTFNVTPAYPFGYGLSYTNFNIQTDNVYYQDGRITVDVTVTNTGTEYAGKEVVQVYYSAPSGKLEKPYQELAAFKKTKKLSPRETQSFSIGFPVERMASYDTETASYILEAGIYYIRVGINSRATHIAGAVKLSRSAVTEQLSNRFRADDAMELLSAKDTAAYTYSGEDEEKAAAVTIEIPLDTIPFKKAAYHMVNETITKKVTEQKITMDDVRTGKYTLDELVGQLTVEELAVLCVGTARDGVRSEAVIGMASTLCPGAAGDTSAILSTERNIRNMVLADGPAGVRLTPDFITDISGNLIMESAGVGFVNLEQLLGLGPRKEIPKDVIHYYQYCTAIPIATLLAQTWDVETIEEAGSIAGEEMEEFGVTLWLAPGMNIHRNPLCGRNFEYYSEDPYVSGICAAADTTGVQKHPGIGTTIKHFALNNQEDNRGHVNAHANERAMREIYLKGFELAVKRAQPMAIMTSYNLINGIHSANNYDLLTAVARDEWGFLGLVMTDWGTTGDMNADAQKYKYTCSSGAACIKAGNDLIMPGSQRDVDEIIRSVGAKADEVYCPITLGDLQACAKHILNILMQSSAYADAVPYKPGSN